MTEDLPWWVAVPLSLIATAAFLYLRRHQIGAWLGFGEKK